MSVRDPLRALAVASVALLGGGVACALWLVAFLATAGRDGPPGKSLFWLLAPPAITALGFAGGQALVERPAHRERTAFWRLYAWPLGGCVAGAVAVYWFGPMLIVFGMLAAGAAAVLAKEVVTGVRRVEKE